MKTPLTTSLSTLLLAAGSLAAGASHGDEVTSAAGGQVTGKLGAEYASFIGPDYSEQVVLGLRDGTAISLPPTNPADPPVVIDSPTGPMGYGNVDHSLALAQARLQQYGIYQPTSEQLQAALTGGEVYLVDASGNVTEVPLDGVLTLRAEGMGWGEIAHQYGMKLGPVVSGKAVVTPLDAEPIAVSDGQTTTLSPKGRGVVTAGGSNAARPGKPDSSGHASGKGIVSAGGTAIGASSASAKAQGSRTGIVTAGGNAYGHTGGGKGIVTAGGGSAGPGGNAYGHGGSVGRGVVTAGGSPAGGTVSGGGGKGLALGQTK